MFDWWLGVERSGGEGAGGGFVRIQMRHIAFISSDESHLSDVGVHVSGGGGGVICLCAKDIHISLERQFEISLVVGVWMYA